MNGLAMGLMRAATGYNQGSRIADDRATGQARYVQQQQRQQQEDADRRVQMQASLDAMKDLKADRVADRQRQGEMDQRSDFNDGFRPAAQFDQFKGAREALGVPDAPTAFSRGGQAMVKAMPSLAEQTAQRVASERAKERAGELAHDETVRKQGHDFQRQQQDRAFSQQRSLQQPRQPDLVTGGDGQMYRFDTRTQSMVQVPVHGLAQATADRAVAQQVPTQQPTRPTPLDTVPGAGFSRGFQSPTAAPQAPERAPQQPQQPRVTFGKAAASGITPEQQKQFADAEVATRQLNGLLDQYRTAVASQGTALWDGNNPDRAAMSSLQRQIMTLYKGPAFANLGVLAGPDLDILNEIISPATGVGARVRGGDAILRQIDQLKGNVEGGRRIRHEVVGVPYKPLAPSGGQSIDDIMGGRR